MMSETKPLQAQFQEGQAASPVDESGIQAVDVWLRRDLATRYNPTLAESLPAAMLALLSEFH